MTYNVISLKEKIAPSFYEVHKAIKSKLYSQIWLKGGRGSTKSSFAAIEIVLGLVEDPKANAICFRKVSNTIRDSLLENFDWAITELGMSEYFTRTVSPAVFTYTPTGQKIILKGLDEPRKIKSIKISKGYFKFLWFEEADEFNGMEEIRSVQQSVLRGGDRFVEFISYNPPQDPKAWVNKESEADHESRFTHHSTYKDVPVQWLGSKFIQDAERLAVNDNDKYRHEYLGEPIGNVDRLIFHGKWEVKDFETPSLNSLYESRFFYGADWGFSQDPTTLIRCFIKDDCLYIDYEAGGVGVEMEDIEPLFLSVPESKKWNIKADNARPETISYVARKGFNIEGATKWSGSVEDGITYLRGFKRIIIHSRCVKTIKEMGAYQYKVDKNTQEILPIVVDKDNHYIDAIRYALSDYITKDVSIFDVI